MAAGWCYEGCGEEQGLGGAGAAASGAAGGAWARAAECAPAGEPRAAAGRDGGWDSAGDRVCHQKAAVASRSAASAAGTARASQAPPCGSHSSSAGSYTFILHPQTRPSKTTMVPGAGAQVEARPQQAEPPPRSAWDLELEAMVRQVGRQAALSFAGCGSALAGPIEMLGLRCHRQAALWRRQEPPGAASRIASLNRRRHPRRPCTRPWSAGRRRKRSCWWGSWRRCWRRGGSRWRRWWPRGSSRWRR